MGPSQYTEDGGERMEEPRHQGSLVTLTLYNFQMNLEPTMSSRLLGI